MTQRPGTHTRTHDVTPLGDHGRYPTAASSAVPAPGSRTTRRRASARTSTGPSALARAALLACATALLLVGCGSGSGSASGATTEAQGGSSTTQPASPAGEPRPSARFADATDVIYRQGPPPVAPEYRRNRTWHMTPQHLHFMAGQVESDLRDVTVPITTEHWQAVLAALDDARLDNRHRPDRRGCDGGHTRTLQVLRGDDVLFDGTGYVCGGGTSGTLSGDHEAVLRAMEQGIDPSVFAHD